MNYQVRFIWTLLLKFQLFYGCLWLKNKREALVTISIKLGTWIIVLISTTLNSKLEECLSIRKLRQKLRMWNTLCSFLIPNKFCNKPLIVKNSYNKNWLLHQSLPIKLDKIKITFWTLTSPKTKLHHNFQIMKLFTSM